MSGLSALFLLQTGTIGDVKAAALDVSGPNTCVAVFVGGGASIETPETAGASKLLEYMAFSATKARWVGLFTSCALHVNVVRAVFAGLSSNKHRVGGTVPRCVVHVFFRAVLLMQP